MKITVFTSNQPRHISLIEGLASVVDEVFAIQECNTVYPGQVEDFFKRSDTMQKYFGHVMASEKEIFGSPRFLPANVQSLSLKSGDLNMVDMDMLKPALDSDYYIVFGSSFIKGTLIDFLLSKRAINIHMGISPYYRGSSCNFWALYDKKPQYVGATIHVLSKGLDSGPMLFHALPKVQEVGPFTLGMLAVKSAHEGLLAAVENGELLDMVSVPQNRGLQIRYTRNRDFDDAVAANYLVHAPTKNDIQESLKKRDLGQFLNPCVS